MLLGLRIDAPLGALSAPEGTAAAPAKLIEFPLDDKEKVPIEAWLSPQDYEVTWDPSISTSGDAYVPAPASRPRLDEGREVTPPGALRRRPRSDRHVAGQAPTRAGQHPHSRIRAPGSLGSRARSLTMREVWRLQGGSPTDWQQLLDKGETPEKLAASAAHAMPPQTALALVDWAEDIAEAHQALPVPQGEGAPRASLSGSCYDREEEAAWHAIQRWLKAWQLDPDQPSRSLVRDVKAPLREPTHLVGGARARPEGDPSIGVETLVVPSAIGTSRERRGAAQSPTAPILGGKDYLQWLDEVVLNAVLSLAWPTEEGAVTTSGGDAGRTGARPDASHPS